MSADLIHFFTVNWFGQFILMLAECLLVTVPLLVAVAYMTYVDRKVWASIQLRRGPNVVGPFGLLQPFADGLKLLLKETIVPSSANAVLFIIAALTKLVARTLGVPSRDVSLGAGASARLKRIRVAGAAATYAVMLEKICAIG